jgi:hypothetical protein
MVKLNCLEDTIVHVHCPQLETHLHVYSFHRRGFVNVANDRTTKYGNELIEMQEFNCV